MFHGSGMKKPPAVNYIVIPIGYKKNEVRNISVRELVIPICGDCLSALQEEEWTLFYCLECGESRWVLRCLAKNKYRHKILWLNGCPECTGKFGGLYFNDPISDCSGFTSNFQIGVGG